MRAQPAAAPKSSTGRSAESARTPVFDLATYLDQARTVLAKRLVTTTDIVGASSDLRVLGLDSLGSLDVVTELEQIFDLEVPDADRTSGVVCSLKALSEALLRAARRREANAGISAVAEVMPSDYEGFCALDLPTVLARHIAAPPTPWAFKFLRSAKARDYEYVTWGQLGERAAGYLAVYRGAGLAEGDVVTLLLPEGPSLVAAVVAAFFGRFLPAVSAFPSEKLPERAFVQWFGKLVAASGTRLIVCEPELAPMIAGEVAKRELRAVVSSARPAPGRLDSDWGVGAPRADAEALVQYSSGTTGVKKAVVLTHRAVLSQVAELSAALDRRPSDIIVSWLPLYHDMGYVACLLFPLLSAIPTVMMSPFDWIRRPELLFEQISEENGSLVWLPNFAFSLCANRVQEAHLANLDLSPIRAVINCSEPVTRQAMTRFAEKLSPYGLRRSALSSSYAMAETTFAVTQAVVGREPRCLAVVRASLAGWAPGRARDVGARPYGDRRARIVWARPPAHARLEIVGRSRGEPFGDGVMGEIRIASPSRMAAYFRDPDATAAAVAEGWYSSGDLGFLLNRELYVTAGRKQEGPHHRVSGKNLYPHEVEEEVGGVEGVKPGRVVVFGIADEQIATERAVLLAEVTFPAGETTKLEELGKEIRTLVFAQFAVTLSDVRLFSELCAREEHLQCKLSREKNRDWYLREIASAADGGASGAAKARM